MNHRSRTTRDRARAPQARPARGRLLSPAGARRPALYLTVAAAGAVLVNVLSISDPPAQAGTASESVSIAAQLGLSGSDQAVEDTSVRPLEQLAASRSEREADQAAAARAQAEADQRAREAHAALVAARAELVRRQQAAAEAKARAEAEAAATKKAAEAAAAHATQSSSSSQPAPAAAPGGSYQSYAMSKLGGDANQFACLENLWGKESGWNPNAQNPSSSAYGIPQFLDSTWAGTGIAKTSDGYRQIDAGLIYIDSRYGSPCGAWGHSQAQGWY
jgi:hypothetical protein